MRIAARRLQPIEALLGSLLLACMVAGAQGPAAADTASAPGSLAHASPASVTVQNGQPSTVRVVNDTAEPLTFIGPAVIPSVGGPPTAFTTNSATVFNANTVPPTEVPHTAEIPVGGYLQVMVTATGDTGTAADAKLRFALRPISARPASRRGQIVIVRVHTGPPRAPVISLAPQVTSLTSTSTYHWLRNPFRSDHGGFTLRLPWKSRETVKGADLPIATSGACPSTEASPSAHLTSESADTTAVTTTCKAADDNDAVLHLSFTDADLRGATYTGTIRLGEDERSDVALTLHRNLGAEIALLLIVAGIVCALLFQRQRNVIGPVRRLKAQLALVPTTWRADDLPGLDLGPDVATQRDALTAALSSLKRVHPLSLSVDDPAVVDISTDIRTLRQLVETWGRFLDTARWLQSLVTEMPKELPLSDAGSTSSIEQRLPAVMTHAQNLLRINGTGGQRPAPTIATLPDYAKEVVEQRRLIEDWRGTADAVRDLFDRVRELPDPGVAELQEEGRPNKTAVLNDLRGLYSQLFDLTTEAELEDAKESFRRLREPVTHLVSDAQTVARIYRAAVAVTQGPARRLLGFRRDFGSYAGATLEADLGGGGDGLDRYLWRSTALAADAEVRRELISYESVAQRQHQIRTATPRPGLSFRDATVSWFLVIVTFAAVTWVGFKLTWADNADFGTRSDLAAAFIWGLVTPTALALLVNAVDRLRTGAVPYVGRIRPSS